MNRARGFTLLEILVALTMFAVVGGTLLQLFDSGLRSARIATERAHAALLARSKLAELLAYNDLQAGQLSGDLDGDYRWQAKLHPPANPEMASSSWLKPLELTLTISWGAPSDENSFDLKSLCITHAPGP